MVTAGCAVSTPFRSREHDELALLVDRMDKRKCGFPFGGGDIEVVGCIRSAAARVVLVRAH